MSVTAGRRGAAWLVESPERIFTPEQLTDEHRLIRQTADEFLTNAVLPHLDRLEAKDWTFVRDLVRRSAELGLIGIDVPEAYDGIALD